MEVQVVIGANYGDEGKGLVSGNLAREAAKENKKILTVFYNGTVQRAHSFGDTVRHCLAAGEEFGSDTYYHSMFVVDPITLWLTQSKVYLSPNCRLILPCDIAANRKLETSRGDKRHGSCGFGLFAAVTRSIRLDKVVFAEMLAQPYYLYNKLREIGNQDYDEIYNMDNFMRAATYIVNTCEIINFEELLKKNHYDTIIYEGGQGLLLDQTNKDDFPHLTPSCVGVFNIAQDIAKLNCIPDLYYVSRTYMTRHGAGPMEAECLKEDINPDIIDLVNQPNPWQGNLRFGRVNLDTLYKRVQNDASKYPNKANINLIFTQLNYTDNKIETINGQQEIVKPDFCTNLYVSDNKTHIELYN